MPSSALQLEELAAAALPRLEHEALAVLLYGSAVEGVANTSSDIDLLAVTRSVRSLQIIDGGPLPVHVEYIPLSELEETIENLDWLYRTRLFDIQFTVARLRRAIVLRDPEGIGRSLVERVQRYRASEDTLNKLHGQARGLYHDAVGAYRAGRYDHAVLLGRLAAQIMTAHDLLSAGELNVGLKWQHRWAEQHFREAAPERWKLYRQALGLGEEESEPAARAALRAAYALITGRRGP